jgi:ornithine carbamoyltransferase
MTTVTTPTGLLRILDLTPTELTGLLDLAEAFKADPLRSADALAGQSVACYFSKPSTRTRVSFEAAVHRLGGLPIMLRPDELQLGRGEPIADTARVMSSYCAAIVIRTFAQSDVQEMADAASVPVINALTDDHHPCQALADLLTLRERFGDLRGLRVAYVGDGNNVAHSLIEAAALTGIDLRLACPDGYRPDPVIAADAYVVTNPRQAVAGAQARTPSTPTCGSRWATTPSASGAWTPCGPTGSRRGSWALRRPTRCSCTACRPIAARRSRLP